MLCIFRINDSSMSFRETVIEFIHFVRKHPMTNFLALSLPCTHMYAFRVPSSPFAYAISSIDTPRRFHFPNLS